MTWKQLGFFILLYLAALQNVPQGALRGGGGGRRVQAWQRSSRSPCPACGRPPPSSCSWPSITGANLFTEPYLLTNGGGPDGASASPVLVMYQQGIEQGHPDVAAAIGVLLVLGVLIIALVNALPGEGLSMSTDHQRSTPMRPDGGRHRPPVAPHEQRSGSRPRAPRVLTLGRRCVFLFPFYYMLVGSLQAKPDTSLAGAFPTPRPDAATTTSEINGRIDLVRVAGQLRCLHRRAC